MNAKVVLVRSLYESNIGATSRAMTNMGFKDLILISPQCEIGYAAQQAAASGQEPLQNRKVYSHWDEFYKNEQVGVRIAFSARDGKSHPLWNYQDILPKLSQETAYLIFGPEDCGLNTNDKNLIHYNVRLPTYGDNSSLNLAQSTLMAMFIFRQQFPLKQNYSTRVERMQASERVFPEQTLKSWITEMGFEVDHRPVNAFTVLRRILLQNLPNEEELQILETVLQQSRRKLKEYNFFRQKYGNLTKDQYETEV